MVYLPRTLPALLLGLSMPCLFAADAPVEKVRTFPDLLVAKVGERDLLLDLHLPEGVVKPPLVIYIHGGAWTQGSRKKFPFSWLVESGYAVAAISYRFSKEAVYPAQIHDCKAAVRWLRAHVGEYGYDAVRIAVIGTSAGGHLAVLLGTTAGNKAIEGDVGGNLGQSSAVQAVVDYFGPTDFILRAQTQPKLTDVPGSRVYLLLGGAPKDNEALAKLASGAWQVTPDDAPLLIFHGTDDPTVLPGQSQRLYEVAKENNLDVAIHLVPKAAHSIEPFLTESNKLLLMEFLEKHLGPNPRKNRDANSRKSERPVTSRRHPSAKIAASNGIGEYHVIDAHRRAQPAVLTVRSPFMMPRCLSRG